MRPFIDDGLLQLYSVRSTALGLESHLVHFYRLITQFAPHVVVVDPISSLMHAGTPQDANSMATRLVDFLKSRNITAYFSSLTSGDAALEKTSLEISWLVDTWLLTRDVEEADRRSRVLYLLKSRGMAHSHQLRVFHMTDQGIELREPRA